MARRSKSPSRRAGTPVSRALGHATAAPRPPRAPPRRARPLRLVGAAAAADRRAARPHAGLRSISLDAARVPGRPPPRAAAKESTGRRNRRGARAHDRARAAASAACHRRRDDKHGAHVPFSPTTPRSGSPRSRRVRTAPCAARCSASARVHAPGDGLGRRLPQAQRPDFMHPVTGCMADFGGRFARLADAFGLPTLADAAEASVALVGPPFVALELIGGLAILLRLKAVALLAFAALHAPTALIVFYDFGSVALAVLWPDLLWFSPRRSASTGTPTCSPRSRCCRSPAPRRGRPPPFCARTPCARALLVAAALRLWRRGRVVCRPTPARATAPCGVLGLAAAVWLAVQCAGPHIGLNTSGGFSMFSSLRFHPDGRTSHSYRGGRAVPPRWRACRLSASAPTRAIVRFANATGGRKLHSSRGRSSSLREGEPPPTTPRQPPAVGQPAAL